MSRRVQTLSTAAVLCALLFVLALSLPVSYVALGPGPADNVLGTDPNSPGTAIISVPPDKAFPTTGRLLLTTVSVSNTLTLGGALVRWLASSDAVVPRTIPYPPQRSVRETEKQDRQDMVDSQDSSTVAALTLLGVPRVIRVAGFSPGGKADGPLRVKDEVMSVDGTPVPTIEGLVAAVSALPAGSVARLEIRRAGKDIPVEVPTTSTPDGQGTRTMLGAVFQIGFTVDVAVSLQGVGGPSAGLMYSLGIIDKLTPGPLTGGRVIAGTGSIDATGSVGLIGGIQQKLLAARREGATVFLVPGGNCDEAVKAHVGGLQLVRVPADKGLAAAYDDLQRLQRGDTALPAC